MFIYLRWNIILIQSCIQTSYVSSKFRRETSHRIAQLHVARSKSDSLDIFQHVSSLTRAVTCFRYASGRSSSSLSLSLSFFSSLWRMLFNAATTVRHVSEKEGEEGASAWAGGQSYRGGWLASVNGFRGQWREISRPVSQELWTRLLRLVPWTRGGSPFRSRPLALADDLESRQKRKKGQGLPSRFLLFTARNNHFLLVFLDRFTRIDAR